MCGFFGIVSKQPIDKALFSASLDTIEHRGPDAQGILQFKQNGNDFILGHRRLSIIDLHPESNQPLVDTSSEHIIIYNGEVYNYLEIKEKLLNLGVSFRTHSDTEVILEAFKIWGPKCLDQFVGMFSFAIINKTTGEVFIARDRAGVKPLYYGEIKDSFFFSSELKPIIKYFKRELKIDNDSIGSYLKRGWIAAPFSIYKGVFKLTPGHYLNYQARDSRVEISKYWDIGESFDKPIYEGTYEEAQEELEELLLSAVEYRMVSDTPVGVFLSGGYDSTTVTAMLQKDRGERLKTFSIGFEQEEFNEAPYARAVADYLKTDHTELIVSERDALQTLERLPIYYDEPFGDSSAIPTMLVSELASKSVKVALSADGGDEVFGGYTRYHQKFGEIEMLRRLKSNHLGGLLKLGLNFLPASRQPQKAVRMQKLRDSLSHLQSDPSLLRLRIEPVHFSNRELEQLILEDIAIQYSAYQREFTSPQSSDLRYMRFMEYQTTMVDDILAKVDRASMSFSLESREPLLDHRLADFAARLPDNYLYGGVYPKRILRDICHKYVPRELVDRPKKGFAIPTEIWMKGILKEALLDYSSPEFLKKQELFDINRTRHFIQNYLEGKDRNHERPWIFLMFQLWCKTWIS